MIKTLTLGYAGEYGARMMTIDLSEEAAMWPDAAAQLLLVRPGEHTPYPADKAVYADGCMTFTPTKADMAIAGQGYAQVYFYGADGNVLGKSSMMITHILASLGGDSTEPPSGDELGYYDKLMQQAALAIAAGESAQEDAQTAAESAAKAEAALEEMKSISTQSGNMPAGGSSGQILAKKSAENYDTHWIDPPSGSGTGSGVADSVAWDNVTDKPSTYPPAAHTHPEYLGKNETAANAALLNGKDADQYALKTDLPTKASDIGALAEDAQAADSAKLDGKEPKYYIQPRKLLDNSDFKISQAGYGGLHGATKYAADRWVANASNIAGLTNGIRISGSTWNCEIRQQLSNPTSLLGKTLTFAVKMRGVGPSGYLGIFPTNEEGALIEAHVTTWTEINEEFGVYTVTCTIPQNAAKIYVAVNNPNDGTDVDYWYDVEWADIYEGAYTADNLPPHIPKGYAAELAECQRYFVRYGKTDGNNHIGYAQAATSTVSNAVLCLSQSMRIYNPTVTLNGDMMLRNGVTDIKATSITVNSLGSGAFAYVAINATNLVAGTMYAVRLVGATLDFSADL